MKKHNTHPAFPALLFYILSVCLFARCNKDNDPPQAMGESATVLLDWYKLQMRMLLNANPATNNQANMNTFGYMGVALYEAVRPGIPGSVSLSAKLYQMPQMPQKENASDYLWGASANAAMAQVIRTFYTGLTNANKASVDSMENAYNAQFSAATDAATFQRSQSFGRAIATAVHEWSKTDNYILSNAGYVLPVFPGAWEPTLPAFAGATTPFIKDARPFLQSSLTVSAPPLPFTYAEDPQSGFYKMVKELYDASKTLTDDQKAMAQFWADVGVGRGYTPSGHLMLMVTQVLENRKSMLDEAAMIYAKTGIALRDAVITLWKIKYQYNVIRPVTYIRKLMDPGWLPQITTPAHPEYPSAHAYISSAILQVLTREFGNQVSFTDNTYSFLGFAPRTYTSFEAVAEEVGLSRFYGGIHYKPSIAVGLAKGKEIGNKAADIHLIQ